MDNFSRGEEAREALAQFKAATLNLSRFWPAGGLANYPAYLPSFDELAADVQAMFVR